MTKFMERWKILSKYTNENIETKDKRVEEIKTDLNYE